VTGHCIQIRVSSHFRPLFPSFSDVEIPVGYCPFVNPTRLNPAPPYGRLYPPLFKNTSPFSLMFVARRIPCSLPINPFVLLPPLSFRRRADCFYDLLFSCPFPFSPSFCAVWRWLSLRILCWCHYGSRRSLFVAFPFCAERCFHSRSNFCYYGVLMDPAKGQTFCVPSGPIVSSHFCYRIYIFSFFYLSYNDIASPSLPPSLQYFTTTLLFRAAP